MAFFKIKLRTLLLSVFLFTIIISSGLIISFTYVKYAKSINNHSLGTIELAGNRAYAQIGCIVKEIEELPSFGMLFFERHPEINLDNKELIAFFFGILQRNPQIFSYYIGKPDGSYLLAFNLLLPKQLPSSFEPVPEDAVYLVLLRNGTTLNSSQIAFYNRDSELLTTREYETNYDPRTRPWYTAAENTKSIDWADSNSYFFIKRDAGVSATKPFYDKEGRLIAIIGGDLSYSLFSDLLLKPRVSENGKAFILDEKGQILLPTKQKSDFENEVVAEAFKTYEKKKEYNFSYDFEKETYLASLHPFPSSNNKNWSILIIAPLSDFFADFIRTQREAVLLSLSILAATTLLIIFISIHISKPIVKIGYEIDRIARLDLDSKVRIPSHIAEIRRIDGSVASMRNALRSFARYVPKELAKQLMRKEHEISLGGEKKTISIFFTDIENFASIAEALPIEKVNVLLTEYFEALSQIILDCGGTIDKYIGDSIMSIWGAPDDLPDFAGRSCTAALLCQSRLTFLNAKWKKEKTPVFETRMGIATGPVFVGNLGTSERMNYSAIGDAVNIAARLQALNKSYRTQIIIGEETLNATDTPFLVRPLEIVTVRGKKQKLKIFELVAQLDGNDEIKPSPEQLELCSSFTKAYNAFETGDMTNAKKLFESIHKKFPEDHPTLFYLERLKLSVS